MVETKLRKRVFYVIDLPERSGALAEFLAVLDDQWLITLLHYRSLGETSPVLMGFGEIVNDGLEKRLEEAGYNFKRVTSEAMNHFL